MMITSTRIRRVEGPDLPTPGVAPVTTLPATPKGLIIGVIAGGAGLFIIGILSIVLLVLPSVLGGGHGGSAVADISSEPVTTWKYDWLGDASAEYVESTPSITDVGNDRVLISATFDTYAYSGSDSGSSTWYEGYDADYEDGYTAGQAYETALNAYLENFAGVYPEIESYFPDGAYDDYAANTGFNDGFYDSYLGEEFGAGAAVEPVDPGFTPVITMLNVASGEELWSLKLADFVDNADYSTRYTSSDVVGTDALLVTAFTTSGTSYAATVTTLDKRTGEVISQFDGEGSVSASSVGSDVIIYSSDAAGQNATVARYPLAGLTGKPLWQTDVDGSGAQPIGQDFLYVYGLEDGQSEVLDAATGTKLPWGDDGASYLFAGGQLLRADYNAEKSTTEIQGWSATGEPTWKRPITADSVRVIGEAVFTADERSGGLDNLVRINPATGEKTWAEAYGDTFDGIVGLQGSTLLLADGEKVVVVDANTGAAKFGQKVSSIGSVFEGSSQYYVVASDEFLAYSYGDKGEVWSYGLADNESVIVAGSRFALINFDKGTLEGLTAS